MRHLIGILLAAAFMLDAAPAPAQTYPSRPIKLLVAYPPGGASDLIARLVADALAKRLGQPVVVENRGGANGNLAGEAIRCCSARARCSPSIRISTPRCRSIHSRICCRSRASCRTSWC
jgi:tripartite-type tricarboxylate transporter receptor subunit TctC